MISLYNDKFILDLKGIKGGVEMRKEGIRSDERGSTLGALC
jgi:hypothetical protein